LGAGGIWDEHVLLVTDDRCAFRGVRYNDLDPGFQTTKAGSQATYTAFFSKYRSIDVLHVRPDPTHDGYFKATLIYHFKNGTVSSPETDSFELRCRGLTRLPFFNCDTDDIKIHDVISPNGI
jgi:hypothetical protein